MLVGLLLTTAAWGQPADQPASNAVAARVDGNPIRISELQEQFKDKPDADILDLLLAHKVLVMQMSTKDAIEYFK